MNSAWRIAKCSVGVTTFAVDAKAPAVRANCALQNSADIGIINELQKSIKANKVISFFGGNAE